VLCLSIVSRKRRKLLCENYSALRYVYYPRVQKGQSVSSDVFSLFIVLFLCVFTSTIASFSCVRVFMLRNYCPSWHFQYFQAWFIRRTSAMLKSIQSSAAEMRLPIHTSHLCRTKFRINTVGYVGQRKMF